MPYTSIAINQAELMIYLEKSDYDLGKIDVGAITPCWTHHSSAWASMPITSSTGHFGLLLHLRKALFKPELPVAVRRLPQPQPRLLCHGHHQSPAGGMERLPEIPRESKPAAAKRRIRPPDDLHRTRSLRALHDALYIGTRHGKYRKQRADQAAPDLYDDKIAKSPADNLSTNLGYLALVKRY